MSQTMDLFTHIGKLSGSDSGDFPETFSKIYDQVLSIFAWILFP